MTPSCPRPSTSTRAAPPGARGMQSSVDAGSAPELVQYGDARHGAVRRRHGATPRVSPGARSRLALACAHRPFGHAPTARPKVGKWRSDRARPLQRAAGCRMHAGCHGGEVGGACSALGWSRYVLENKKQETRLVRWHSTARPGVGTGSRAPCVSAPGRCVDGPSCRRAAPPAPALEPRRAGKTKCSARHGPTSARFRRPVSAKLGASSVRLLRAGWAAPPRLWPEPAAGHMHDHCRCRGRLLRNLGGGQHWAVSIEGRSGGCQGAARSAERGSLGKLPQGFGQHLVSQALFLALERRKPASSRTISPVTSSAVQVRPLSRLRGRASLRTRGRSPASPQSTPWEGPVQLTPRSFPNRSYTLGSAGTSANRRGGDNLTVPGGLFGRCAAIGGGWSLRSGSIV